MPVRAKVSLVTRISKDQFELLFIKLRLPIFERTNNKPVSVTLKLSNRSRLPPVKATRSNPVTGS